ncbi:hypothetical protein SESBI_01681 [Sesbania bispinosa]|nr:hypothetical protein SESBI_01681 [Sesbania bispinosa]
MPTPTPPSRNLSASSAPRPPLPTSNISLYERNFRLNPPAATTTAFNLTTTPSCDATTTPTLCRE